jgi:hypothetical protein
MKILIFLQGTILMHRSGLGRTREERVRQVLRADASIFDWVSYVPIGHAPAKMREWSKQGASIAYVSSHKTMEDIRLDTEVLSAHGFPAGVVYFRWAEEHYADLAERIRPDLLIENDGESGRREPIYANVHPEFRARMKSIVVREFGGIDHLPDEISTLMFLPDGAGF